MKFTIYIHRNDVYDFLEGKTVIFQESHNSSSYLKVVIKDRTLFKFTKSEIPPAFTFNQIQIL
jgi:hypothetical protein